MTSDNEIEKAISEYFKRNPIDIEAIKQRYKDKNRIKLLDDSNAQNAYTLGVNNAKLYMTEVIE